MLLVQPFRSADRFRLGRKALEEVAQIVRPETILGWHRRLIAKKFDGSKKRSPDQGGSTSDKIEELVLQMARENRSWGYRRIVGALSNLGHEISHQTVANILKRHDITPAPERGRTMSWREFIRSHAAVLAAVDFFTAAVWTAGGLTTYYVLTCMRVAIRSVCIVGITTSPDNGWMEQMARNISFAEVGFLNSTTAKPHEIFDHTGLKLGLSSGDWIAHFEAQPVWRIFDQLSCTVPLLKLLEGHGLFR